MKPDTKVDRFPTSIHRYNTSRAFQCTAPVQNGGRDRRLWLSCASACFLTAGPKKDLWLSAICAVVNGERRSRALKSRRGFLFPPLYATAALVFLGPPETPPPPRTAGSGPPAARSTFGLS